ncbi:DUF2231 domain-containing protein [Flindersiella endophytica]
MTLAIPTFITGLPLHVLIVHAVVVLVPIAVLASVAVAVWPAARRRYGWPAVALAAVATACVPLATSTGEGLRDRLPSDRSIASHAELGDQLLVFVAPMLVTVTAMVWLDWYRSSRTRRAAEPDATQGHGRSWHRPVAGVLAVTTVAFALLTGVQVLRIGDSGARAAWGDTHYVAPSHADDDDD